MTIFIKIYVFADTENSELKIVPPNKFDAEKILNVNSTIEKDENKSSEDIVGKSNLIIVED